MKTFCISLAAALLVATGAVGAAGTPTEEANKRLVIAFYERIINQKDLTAVDELLGPVYIQHNPSAADGPEGLKGFIGFLREKYPNSHSEIKRAFADGDIVILHVHAVREPGTRGFAIIDIFRLDGGKIVEHWDVRQKIPEKPANANGMF